MQQGKEFVKSTLSCKKIEYVEKIFLAVCLKNNKKNVHF